MESTPVIRSVVIPALLDRDRRGIGGIATFVRALEPRLQARGWKVTLLGTNAGRANAATESSCFIGILPRAFARGAGLAGALWLRRRKWDFAPETVIHLQRPDHGLGFRQRRWPQIITFHGRHQRSWRKRGGRVGGWIYRHLERSVCGAADALIFVSQADMNMVLHSQPELAEKTHHVPVGVDRGLFCLGDRRAARDDLHLPHDVKAIAWAGRIEKEKNLPALIAACGQIPDCHLWIAGAGTQEEHCRKRANERVRFLGRLDPPKIVTLFQASHALALASEYEGLPTVALEAWACGRPMVVPPVGDLPELLAQGGGIVVPNSRPESLAHGIRAVLQTKEEEESLRARSESYDWERIADQIISVYASAARRHAKEMKS